MRITLSAWHWVFILGLAGCDQWAAPQVISHPLQLYEDDNVMADNGVIAAGEICQIDQSLSGCKVYCSHKIQCCNGQAGYISIDAKARIDSLQRAAPQVIPHPLPLYGQSISAQEEIAEGTLCQISDDRLFGQSDVFHQIKCENGQVGYIRHKDKRRFDSLIGPPQKAPLLVVLYPDIGPGVDIATFGEPVACQIGFDITTMKDGGMCRIKEVDFTTIEEGAMCQIDQRVLGGEFYYIQCENDQFGYIGTDDKKRFDDQYDSMNQE
jgi:hypothetical protein